MPTLNRNSKTKYLDLAELFRSHMSEGRLSPGDKLPTFAQLKAEYGFGQTTLEKTYSILEAERLIVRKPGRGTFVAEPNRPVLKNVIAIAEGTAEQEMAGQHPFYAHLLAGIRQAAKQAGMRIMLLGGDTAVDWDTLDGVLMLDEYVQWTHRIPLGLPRVSVLRNLENAPSVLTDDYSGSRVATEYLLSLGHRRIAFMTQARQQDIASGARLRGYHEALQSAGIEPASSWVRDLRDPWAPYSTAQEMGLQQMRKWLAEDWRAMGCTAILAQNDEAAIGVQKALHEAGLKVPADVSIVGFDGTEIADYASPRLTTVKIPLEEIGARSVELLLENARRRLEEGTWFQPGNDVIVLPAELRIGESTAPCHG